MAKQSTIKRSVTIRNLYDKRKGATVTLTDPVFCDAIGSAERKGIWLIYGPEKNGKSTLTLRLLKDIAASEKVAYISAEEGLDDSFRSVCKRVGLTPADRVLIDEYIPFEDLIVKYKKPRAPKVVFLDNLTIYIDEIKQKSVLRLMSELPNTLFVLIAHEERNEPAPSSARMAKKMAKVIINVKGLKAFVTSRFAPPGGEIIIDEQTSSLYWGYEVQK